MRSAPGWKLSICCFSPRAIPAPFSPTREFPIGQAKLVFSGLSSTSPQTLSDSTAQGTAEAAVEQGHTPQAMPPGVMRDPRPSACPGLFFFNGPRRGTAFPWGLLHYAAPRAARGGGGEARKAVPRADKLPGKGKMGLLPRGHWRACFENNPRATEKQTAAKLQPGPLYKIGSFLSLSSCSYERQILFSKFLPDAPTLNTLSPKNAERKSVFRFSAQMSKLQFH